jgi:hypothetical protein
MTAVAGRRRSGDTPATTQASRRAGRPSVAPQRRAEIVDAFIRLVAERGLEAVTLDRVAAEAGVRRATSSAIAPSSLRPPSTS